MTAADFPAPTFELWCAVISHYLLHAIGRTLADAPAGIEGALQTWYVRGVTAHVVAVALSGVRWPAVYPDVPDAKAVAVLRMLATSRRWTRTALVPVTRVPLGAPVVGEQLPLFASV